MPGRRGVVIAGEAVPSSSMSRSYSTTVPRVQRINRMSRSEAAEEPRRYG